MTTIRPDRTAMATSGLAAPSPKRIIFAPQRSCSTALLFVAAIFYLLPLYVMVVTSLKGMPEIRMGNIFAPPMEITLRALGQGLGDGLHRPLLRRPQASASGTRCKITVPSVIVSIAIASVNGYALAIWRFKGADIFFTILLVGAFIPYQVMLYPIVIILRELGIFATLSGRDPGPHHLRHADPDAAVPQLLRLGCRLNCSRRRASTAPASGASTSASCCRCRCRSSWSAMILQVTGIWNDFLFGVDLRRHDELSDDGAAEQHRQFGAGREGIQRQHGRHAPDRCGAAHRLLRVREGLFVRGIAAGAVKG